MIYFWTSRLRCKILNWTVQRERSIEYLNDKMISRGLISQDTDNNLPIHLLRFRRCCKYLTGRFNLRNLATRNQYPILAQKKINLRLRNQKAYNRIIIKTEHNGSLKNGFSMIFSSVSETKASSPVIGAILLKYYLEFTVFFRPIKR